MRFFLISFFACILSFILAITLFKRVDFSNLKKRVVSRHLGLSLSNTDPKIKKTLIVPFSPDIKNIRINAVVAKVSLKPAPREDFYLKAKIMEETFKDKLSFKKNNDTVELIIDSNNRLPLPFFSKPQMGSVLELYIPQESTLKLDLNLVIGDVEIDNLSFTDTVLTLTAGDIEIKNSSIKNIKIDAFAGDIDIDKSRITTGELTTTAGNIDLSDSHLEENFSINTTVGDIDIQNINSSPKLEIITTAGNIKIITNKPNFVFKTTTLIGNIEIKNYRDKTETDEYVFGDGVGNINILSSFGSIRVN